VRNLILGLSALLFLGCPKPQEEIKTPSSATKPAEGKEPAVSQKNVTIKHNGELFMGKPPLKILYFDVTLKNEQKTARWFLLPSTLPESVSRPDGGVDTLEIFEPKGSGKVIAISLLGTNKLGWAFLLPGEAQITVKRLAISDWEGDIPKQLEITSIIATDLTFGGKPAASYFKADPSCDSKAEVSFEKSKVDSMTGSVHFSEDSKELPIQFKSEQAVTLTVPISWKM
jgi:hypothetical protein